MGIEGRSMGHRMGIVSFAKTIVSIVVLRLVSLPGVDSTGPVTPHPSAERANHDTAGMSCRLCFGHGKSDAQRDPSYASLANRCKN